MKIHLSKTQWEHIGKTAGWMKESQIIPDDGFADGGEPYTQDEIDFIDSDKFSKTPVEPTHQKELDTIVDKYEPQVNFDSFVEFKRKYGITTLDIYDELEKQFPRKQFLDLYKKFEFPTGMENAIGVIVQRIQMKLYQPGPSAR